MAEIKVYLSNALSEKFRRIAMSVYGYGRGSLSKAAEEAFTRWCTDHDKTEEAAEKSNLAEIKSNDSQEKGSRIDPDERKIGVPDSKEDSGFERKTES